MGPINSVLDPLTKTQSKQSLRIYYKSTVNIVFLNFPHFTLLPLAGLGFLHLSLPYTHFTLQVLLEISFNRSASSSILCY